jgi:hypothetical protein
MAENSSKTRRNFLKTVGAAGVAGLAGCNGLGGNGSERADNGSATEDPGPPNPTDTQNTTENDTQGYTENDTQDYTENDSQGSTENDTQDSPEEDTGEPDPSYSIQGSPLQYDLTDLATSETYSHDEAYIRDNYSAELGVTVLEDGEEVSLEELGDVHLENEEGEQVEITDQGYVPEYEVEDGEEITVKATVGNQNLQATASVDKNTPEEFGLDADLVDSGEVIFSTEYSTPYKFDSFTVDRQEVRDRRIEGTRETTPASYLNIDEQEFEENWERIKNWDKPEWKKKLFLLTQARARVVDAEAEAQSPFNSLDLGMASELAIRDADFVEYDDVFIGDVTNTPPEEDAPTYDTLVAFVDGDWYHLGTDYAEAYHIDTITEDPSEIRSMNSVGAHSEFGSTLAGEANNDFNPLSAFSNRGIDTGWVDEEQAEWKLNEIQDNSAWDEFMHFEEMQAGLDEEFVDQKDVIAEGSGEETDLIMKPRSNIAEGTYSAID